jgi:hypothetical protein
MSNPGRHFNRQQETALRTLSFDDNFESFEVEMTIPAASEISVRNQFRDGKVPSFYIVVEHIGEGQIRKGSTTWTAELLYMKNVHATEELTARVRFFK